VQQRLCDHNLMSCMSRRGNYHDNAMVQSFLQLLKREQALLHKSAIGQGIPNPK
jgi:transposase InsO family protein